MSKVLGNALIKVDGDLCKTIGDSVEFDPGGYEREEVMADNQFHYKEKPRGSRLSCKFAGSEKTKLKNLTDLADGQIEIIMDTGVSYTMTNATRMGEPPKVSSGDGTIAFEAMGDPIQLPQ
jgi:hypothetical protein